MTRATCPILLVQSGCEGLLWGWNSPGKCREACATGTRYAPKCTSMPATSSLTSRTRKHPHDSSSMTRTNGGQWHHQRHELTRMVTPWRHDDDLPSTPQLCKPLLAGWIAGVSSCQQWLPTRAAHSLRRTLVLCFYVLFRMISIWFLHVQLKWGLKIMDNLVMGVDNFFRKK
jgi:hypothetical protein